MKIKITFFLLAINVMGVFSQTQWTKHSDYPVLSMDTTLQWESMGQPTCIIHNDTLKMWYAVASDTLGGLNPRGRICYAWSLDGILWNAYPGNPVLTYGDTGEWDMGNLDTPEILWDGSQFRLYYYGDSTVYQTTDNTAIGLATSPDGIHWIKQGKVLHKGGLGDWDKNIESPAAYFDPVSGLHAMIYTGQDTVGWIRLGLAVSMDGMNWIKHPSPVLDHGNPGSWDDMFVAVPAVIRSGPVFEMWYSGLSSAGQWDSVFVGYAVSLNGISWIKYAGNPVLSTAAGDTSRFWAVDVVWDEISNEYKLWYENGFKWGAQAIYYATAPRTVLFSNSCSINVSNDTIINAGDSFELHAEGGTYFQWDPEDGLSDANIQNPMASPDTTTKYTVLIVSETCITVDSVMVTVIPASVPEQNEKGSGIDIFPNPTTDILNIRKRSGDFSANDHYELYDFIGKKIYQESIKDKSSVEIDLLKYPSGLYFVIVYLDKEIIAEKIEFVK